MNKTGEVPCLFNRSIIFSPSGSFRLALPRFMWGSIDQYRNNPEPVVMKWGFILVTLYMGPLGPLLYVLADKEPPRANTSALSHRSGDRLSARPCIAGDATGIILAAAITAALGLPMWKDFIVEYLTDFSSVIHLPVALHEVHDGRHVPGECQEEFRCWPRAALRRCGLRVAQEDGWFIVTFLTTPRTITPKPQAAAA